MLSIGEMRERKNIQGRGSRSVKGLEVRVCLVVEGIARRHMWLQCSGGGAGL